LKDYASGEFGAFCSECLKGFVARRRRSAREIHGADGPSEPMLLANLDILNPAEARSNQSREPERLFCPTIWQLLGSIASVILNSSMVHLCVNLAIRHWIITRDIQFVNVTYFP
jgi:hypothetical protein